MVLALRRYIIFGSKYKLVWAQYSLLNKQFLLLNETESHVLCYTHAHIYIHVGLMLSLDGVSYPNNSVFFVDEIGVFVGQENNALTCTTQYRPCCFSPSNRHGEWYYPNGTKIPNAAQLHNFYRGRTDNGEVYLNHFRNSRSPIGHFWCSLPGIDGSMESIHVTLSE